MARRKRSSWNTHVGACRKGRFWRKHFSDLHSAKSFFSYSCVKEYLTRCTSSEGRLCKIFSDLAIWNEFFWPVGLYLTEFSPGQLSLARLEDKHNVSSEMRKRLRMAATVLHYLLTVHRCVASVELTPGMCTDHHELMCDALRESQNLRKLRVMEMTTNASRSFVAALPYLNHLEELECENVGVFDTTAVGGLSEFLASTQSLTALGIDGFFTQDKDAVVFLQGLKSNATITTLSLKACIFCSATSRLSDMFADYLRGNQTLRNVIVESCHPHDADKLRPIIKAVSHKITFRSLKLIGFSLDNANMKPVKQLLCQNRSLEKFCMNRCVWFERAPGRSYPGSMHHMDNIGTGLTRNSPWMVSRTRNKKLEELAVDLLRFEPHDNESFYSVLASRPSPEIGVNYLRGKNEDDICRTLQERGVQESFSFDMQHISQGSGPTLTECKLAESLGGTVKLTATIREYKELSCRSVYSNILPKLHSLQTTFRLLQSCSHVTSLRIRLRKGILSNEARSLIAQYIASTRVLRELELAFFDLRTFADHHANEQKLVRTLSNNKSIRSLTIEGLLFQETEVELLADMLLFNRTLSNLTFYAEDGADELLIENLTGNFCRNYTLLDMEILNRYRFCRNNFFPLRTIVQRNVGLVSRAAHFVLGVSHRYCAEAVELVQHSPGLVAKVRELAAIDEAEAVSRIKRSLRTISDLDVFMCIAGVVKNSVTCHRREDGYTQLDNLGPDCWLHIRQYLKIGDILDVQ